ncbi:hypothetical protein [Nocardioides gilvus]|uniref:hypothetical protein n=1 Tax=Nocardioides gilvus TaxID=1735589 RepID=UPI0013A57876|nr:hypothetical protein [Nocardioides gilvus]
MAPIAGLVTSLALASVSQHFLTLWSKRKIYRRTAIIMARSLVPVSMVAGSLVFATAYYPAIIQHAASEVEPLNSAPQPEGSFLVYEVPERVAALLIEEYQAMGEGQAVRYFLPRERKHMWRATSTSVLDCMDQGEMSDPHHLPEECYPKETLAPINATMLAAEGPTQADSNLLSGSEVGLLRFPAGSPRVDRLARTKAVPDKRLGGNLPGVVVVEGSPTARRMGLERSGSELLALYDFGALTQENQARLRALTTRLAPAAQVAEADMGRSDRAVSLSALIAGLGVAGVWLVVLPAGLAAVVGHRRTRRILVDLGRVRVRRRVAWLWVFPLGATIAAAGLLGRWAAGTAGAGMHGSYGWAWTASMVAGLVVVTVIQRAFVAVPGRAAAE